MALYGILALVALMSLANAQVAEAIACRDGVRLATERGFAKAILETDPQSIVNLWNSRGQHQAKNCSLLGEIEELN